MRHSLPVSMLLLATAVFGNAASAQDEPRAPDAGVFVLGAADDDLELLPESRRRKNPPLATVPAVVPAETAKPVEAAPVPAPKAPAPVATPKSAEPVPKPAKSAAPPPAKPAPVQATPAVPDVTPPAPVATPMQPAPVVAPRKMLQGGMPLADFDSASEPQGLPDRWHIVDALGYPRNLLDPYNTNNPLKGDKFVFGKDWFVSLNYTSDTVFESRYVPVPVGGPTTAGSNTLDTIGDGAQVLFSQSFILENVLYKGDTTFRPPDIEVRFTPVINFNQVTLQERGLVNVDPTAEDSSGTKRTDSFVGVQALYADVHLRNVSDRYDFDSIRVGIQPFTADFRSFVFNDSAFGVRLFGIRANNVFQYNLAWLRRIEKDTNSGLNDISLGLRNDDVYVFNLYWQDLPQPGFTSQAVLQHNRNSEGRDTYYDDNGFLVRPSSIFNERGRDYTVTYLGYNGDGHFGSINLSASLYYAFGSEDSMTRVNTRNDVSATFAAAEVSRDFDWMRFRISGLYASADQDPYDDVSTGFDAVLENPQFAGADTSYWIRQALPLIGGGGVTLSGRNGVLNALRSSKDEGQSNFTNPGSMLFGVGGDFDVLPQLRASFNVNMLNFVDTAVLEILRQQSNIDTAIGTDISLALIYRPFMTQNVIARFSYAMLLPGGGYKALYGDDENPYSLLFNLILNY